MQDALDQGEIPTKINAIPNNKLISEVYSLSLLFAPTENIITGILNNITIILPIEKFESFNKFIEAEIETRHEKINDAIIKVKIKIYSSFILRLKNILASGIEIRNGICRKRKCEMIFKKAINS